jgi:large subunit ribosomal protein L35
MPKMKTKKAAKKRFRLSGTGRVRRPKGGLQHMMMGKSRKRTRRLRNNDMVAPEFEARIKSMLPYG